MRAHARVPASMNCSDVPAWQSIGRLRAKRARAATLALLCLTGQFGAHAETQPQALGNVDEIVVVAAPGPPIWHVTRGTADVVVLGTVTPIPVGLKWSRKRLSAGLQGARRLVLGPEAAAGYAWSRGMTRASFAALWGPSLSQTLPAGLLERYLSATRFTRIGKSFDHRAPSAVGIILVDHGRLRLSLTSAEPAATIRQMALRKNVKSLIVAPHAYLPTLDELSRLSPADQERCLSEELDNLDREKDGATTIARAWAVGDLRTLRARYRPPSACEDVIARDADARQAVVQSTLNEIRAGLAAGGRTVVSADVSLLLDRSFFGRLEADGATVRYPRE